MTADRPPVSGGTNTMTPNVFNRDELDRLEQRISARIDTGVGAARYDGDPGSHGGKAEASHPERAVLASLNGKTDKTSTDAIADLAALHAAVATIEQVSAANPSLTAGQATIPGITPCPASQCVAHWAAGLSVKAVSKPKRRRCRRCHDFHTSHGDDYPPLVLRAVSDLGGTSGPLGAGVWDHALVLRAWDASGWIAKPVPTKRSA